MINEIEIENVKKMISSLIHVKFGLVDGFFCLLICTINQMNKIMYIHSVIYNIKKLLKRQKNMYSTTFLSNTYASIIVYCRGVNFSRLA